MSSIQNKISISRLISGTLLIAGTTVGAGMLGIPLATAAAGFWPATVITACVWLFMLLTGFLFLNVSLSMPDGANILSIAHRFFGVKGKIIAGVMFAFLYYCLLIAYFAAGAPLVTGFFHGVFGIEIQSDLASCFIFGLIFASIVASGAKAIDRANILLAIGMILSYILLIGLGSQEVEPERLNPSNWPVMFFGVPVLFSAFGYHNMIPSLCTYLKRERKTLRLAIILGTTIPLIIYILWQWLIIGAIPMDSLLQAQASGQPATSALQNAVGNPWIYIVGQYFAFFAIVTSLLGVAFSMVDFLGDGLKLARTGAKRILLTFLVFFPPFLCAVLDPTIFDRALGIAGGIGEAFLNGLFPVALVWMGRYVKRLDYSSSFLHRRPTLSALGAISLFVMILELIILIK